MPQLDLSHHDDEIDDLEDHVILAVDNTPNGIVGCAYYIARHELLCCMQDIESAGPDVIQTLKLEVEPTIVIQTPRVVSQTPSIPHDTLSSVIQNDDQVFSPYETVVRPLADFKYETAVHKLCKMDLADSDDMRYFVPGENMDYDGSHFANETGQVDEQGKYLTIASKLDLDSRLSIGCSGAVISYLQRKRASEYLEHDPQSENAYRISRVEMFTLKSTMLLNADTLSSLQIMQSETHPNVDKQGPHSSGSKESLSVFGIFHCFAKTPQGKGKLRQLMLRPSLDLPTIATRHDLISVLIRSDNQAACQTLSDSLRRIKNMRITITSLHKGVERGNQHHGRIKSGVWAALMEFCFHAIDVGETLREVAGSQQLELLTSVLRVLNKPKLQQLGKMIFDVVDLEESLEHHRTVVKRGINENLDRVKDAYTGIEEVLAKTASEITETMPIHIERQLDVVFLPQLGFHITVPLDEWTRQAVWNGNGAWEKRFVAENCQYFKNERMREMDSDWGDLHVDICDAEIEISHELAQQVLQNENWLLEASDLCGDLDCVLALVHGALHYRLVRPNMVEDNVIDIKAGRHILQEMSVESYVANDSYLTGSNGEDSTTKGPSLLLLTGPNYSGKSVYMKQIALIVYMAQIGSFVPVKAATLGITDKIFTRINTAETVSKVQSAFVIDLQQIAWALRSCTNRSLLVIDEFGKGTDPCDGAGLAAGVFKYLLDLGSEAPKVLASTHLHEIFEKVDFEDYPGLQFAYTQVLIPPTPLGKECDEHITYLYNICQGRSSLSYGIQCAESNGIPEGVIRRAKLLADLRTQGEDLVASCALLPHCELEELEKAEENARKFISANFDDETVDIRAVLRAFL